MKRAVLITLRNSAGYTQEEVAGRAKITRSYYGLIETGFRNPTLPIAERIAGVYGLPLDVAFQGEIFFANRCYEMKQVE